LLLSWAGKAVFHGSAVDVDGGAVAFLGDSGAGKSTLAASFAMNGKALVTDDGLEIEAASAGFRVNPSHPSFRLWGDSEEALTLTDQPTAPQVSFTDKRRFIAGGGLSFSSSPLPLRCAFFLGDGSAQTVSIERLSESQAMMHWVRNAFLLDPADKRRLKSHFEQTSLLATRAESFALDYPRSFDRLPETRDEILRKLAGLG
jgi:hypothetical protein